MTAILLLRIHCSTNNRRVLRFLRHPSIALFTLMNCEKQFFPELADAYQQCCSFHTKSMCKMRGQNPALILGLGESPNKRKCGWVAPRHCLRLWNQKTFSTAVLEICRDLNMVIWNVDVIIQQPGTLWWDKSLQGGWFRLRLRVQDSSGSFLFQLQGVSQNMTQKFPRWNAKLFCQSD